MMNTTCECLRCGYKWTMRGQLETRLPRQCPKCKSPRWSVPLVKQESAERVVGSPDEALDDHIRELARQVFEESMSGLPVEGGHDVPQNVPAIVPPGQKPDMDTLRAICAGKTSPSVEPVASGPQPCSYTEYDGESGETYRCGLSAHSHKVKHTRGTKV